MPSSQPKTCDVCFSWGDDRHETGAGGGGKGGRGGEKKNERKSVDTKEVKEKPSWIGGQDPGKGYVLSIFQAGK